MVTHSPLGYMCTSDLVVCVHVVTANLKLFLYEKFLKVDITSLIDLFISLLFFIWGLIIQPFVGGPPIVRHYHCSCVIFVTQVFHLYVSGYVTVQAGHQDILKLFKTSFMFDHCQQVSQMILARAKNVKYTKDSLRPIPSMRVVFRKTHRNQQRNDFCQATLHNFPDLPDLASRI